MTGFRSGCFLQSGNPGCMEDKVVTASRGSVELIVLGLLAALVVALAFPMLSRFDRSSTPTGSDPGTQQIVDDPLPVD